jgi:hypothetical protein
MNPADPHSSLTALRQLKEMLDAGTITPAEFEVLKRQIVFGVEPALPLAPPASPEPVAPAFAEPASSPASADVPATYLAAEKETISPPEPVFQPLATPPAAAEWPATEASGQPYTDEEQPTEPEEAEAERRNPLNLIFAIGGLLVFLGVIAYLMLGRSNAPNEHLTSTSQTAADSTATTPEVGPQAEQLNLPPAAAPETIRVAPVVRPAPAQNAGQFQVDSSATPAPAAPVKKAAVPTPAPTATPVATDSASKTP